jgi:aminoglycoside 3-N-acetyltransferase
MLGLGTVLNFMRRALTPPITQIDLERAFKQLGMNQHTPLIVHSSLSSLGNMIGGANSVLNALERYSSTLVMPAFTYYTLVWPALYRNEDWPISPGEDGPPFRPDSPVSRDIGRIPQGFLERPQVLRSQHPALSFAAQGADAQMILGVQTLEHPYAPIGVLEQLDALVLLLGVDHRSNTSIHYGEYVAGRPMLERWANTKNGIVRTYYPNCSAAFNGIEGSLNSLRSVDVGHATLQVARVREIVAATKRLISNHSEALLCSYPNCRCQNVRAKIRRDGIRPRRDIRLEEWLGMKDLATSF